MLHLQHGMAMSYITELLEYFGYTWAYRVVDTLGFGIPQRRRRVFLVASATEDPADVLFADDAGSLTEACGQNPSFGFYWTEGNRGLGWAIDAVPTLKGGSGLAIPSAPAIWHPQSHAIGTPDIRDAERLQGFPLGWTAPAKTGTGNRGEGHRWRLLGNAVSIPVAYWIGRRLLHPGESEVTKTERLSNGQWPTAAWGHKGQRFRIRSSAWPLSRQRTVLADFLRFAINPLSLRATEGFYRRVTNSSLRTNSRFLADLARHIDNMKGHRNGAGSPVSFSRVLKQINSH